ncbi:MAG: aminomethyltransferase [Planctomycetota bacterium]
MTTQHFYRIDRLSVVDVGGQDADTILNNLTTNDMKSLEAGQGRETFVTEVRGRSLSHAFVYRQEGGLRLISPEGPSEAIAAHVDRYTIREDATPSILDNQWVGFVVPPGEIWEPIAEALGAPKSKDPSEPLVSFEWEWNGHSGTAYENRWLGEGTLLLLLDRSKADIASEQEGARLGDEADFHSARTMAGFPWFGIDLNEKNLPQEADRDSLAISFTKGCYLGQETVARLDALGKVQKKLVQWKVVDTVPTAGTPLKMGEKVVGRLTSVAAEGDGCISIGMARRTHFDPGSTAEGSDETTETTFTATVL